MKKTKKILAIVFTISILLGMIVVPSNAITVQSGATMPDGFAVFDDFENTIVSSSAGKDGWRSNNDSNTVGISTSYSYSGKSMMVTLGSDSSVGAYLYACEHAVKGEGLAFWLYIPSSAPAVKNFDIYVNIGTDYTDKSTDQFYARISTANLTTGAQIITIPWSDFVRVKGERTFSTEDICITKIELKSNAGTDFTYYIDQIGFYGIPPVTMPGGFAVIDDFENTTIASSGGKDVWRTGNAQTVESSTEYSYAGKSMKVVLDSKSTSGTWLYGCEHKVKGDGLAFWLYFPSVVPTGKNFIFEVYLGTAYGDTSTKYTITLSTNNLSSGAQLITIPWSDLQLSTGTNTFKTENICITKMEFKSNAGESVTYYVDQIGFYGVPGVTMPEGFVAIEDFEQGNTRGWSGTSDANIELTTDYGFGEESTSVHVHTDSSTSGFKGFKTNGTQNIACKGDGIVFWAYNAGAANSRFYVKLSNSDGAFEKMITLNAGEGLYQIPWTDFKSGDNAIDTTKAIIQIEFTASATTLDYYVDNIGFYNVSKESVTIPEKGFMLIDDFEDTAPLAWYNKSNATFELTDAYGYGAAGKSGHVTITSSGYNGMQSGTVNIIPNGDGITFWAYNSASELSSFYIVLTQSGIKYEAKITLEQDEKYYEIAWNSFGKQNETATKFNVNNGVITKIEMYASASAGEFYIDQLGFYNVQPHNLEMPYGFAAVENFDSASTTWKSQGSASMEYSTTLGYNTSAHVTWSTGGWNGINSGSSNANISPKGDGFTFWAYNNGSQIATFYVVLAQGNTSATKYETTIALPQGESVYTIPWSQFIQQSDKTTSVDPSISLTQIVLQVSSAVSSGDIYIDQIGFYGVPIIDTFEDFENGFENLGWEATNGATLTQSTENTYDGSSYSAYATYTDTKIVFSGFKTSSKKQLDIVSTDEGVAFCAYNAGEQIDDFYVRLVNQYTVSYEAKITLKAGSAVYKIPYNEFKHMENAEKSFNVGDKITQFEVVAKSTSLDCYFDNFGFYKYSLPVAELPINYTVIDDFEVGMTGSGTIGWKAFGDATAEISRDYSSDKDGGKRSMKVSIDGTSWSGAKANPSEYVYNNDSIAFELYVPTAVNTSNFVFKVALNGITGVYYEKNIAEDLELGKNLIIIPFDELVSTSDKVTKLSSVVQPTDKISNIEFTAAANGAIYYVDNIVIYESVCSTEAMPYTYSVIEDFNRDIAVPQSVLNATVESSANHRYGDMGKSAHAYWETNTAVGDNRWSGIKYNLTSNITIKSNENSGAGIVFWAYNNGDKLNYFTVKLLCNDNKYYEAKMTLDKGECIYTIPYSRFGYESNYARKLPADAIVTQIEFLSCDEGAADYYVDEVGVYYMDSVDVNFDSNINDDDVSLARYILLGLEPENTGLSDTNGDGIVNICDLVKIDEFLSKDDNVSSDATVEADYAWHPGLIDKDVTYDLSITVNGATTTTAILSCANQDVIIDGYNVIIPYGARASGNDLILTVSDSSRNYLGTINIPCKSWTQSFSDEFALEDGSSFDANKWGNSSSCSNTATNGVSYTENNRAGITTSAYEIKDGKLVMKITDEDCYSGTNKYNYSEFCVSTKDSFRQKYGLFEANIATSGIDGVNTAFWLLPYGSIPEQFAAFKKADSSYGLSEIDILETPVYNDAQVAQINEHYYDYLNDNDHLSLDGPENKFSVENIEQQHTYSCAWLESGIYYYIDNELVYSTTDVQAESEDGEKMVRRAYMIIDVSYQGTDSWLGTPPDDFDELVAAGKVNADVDWVRAYK